MDKSEPNTDLVPDPDKESSIMVTRLLWFFSFLCTLVGGIVFIYGLIKSDSAMESAKAAAMGAAFAIIPYCLARAWSELNP
jgi:hypothetical protein